MKYVVIFTFSFFCSFSQFKESQVDSLNKILKRTNVSYTEKIKTLNTLALYYGEFDIEKAIKYNNRILILSKEKKYITGFGYYNQNIANRYMILGNFKLAEKHAIKASYFFKKANDNNNYLLSVYAHSFALDFQGKGKDAESLVLETIEKYESKPNNERIVELYYYISTLYNDQNKPKTAFYYINKALLIYTKKNIDNGIFKCNYLLASICHENGMYTKSNDYLKKSFPSKNNLINIKVENIINVNNLYTKNYIELKKYHKALFHCKILYKKAKEKNIEFQLTLGNLLFAEIYTGVNQFDKAHFFLNKLESIKLEENYEFNKNTIKSKLYFKQNDFEKALKYCLFNYKINENNKANLKLISDCYLKLNQQFNSIKFLQLYSSKLVETIEKEKNNQIFDYEALYQVKNKEIALNKSRLENDKKELALHKQKNYTVFFSLLSIALMFIFILLFKYYKNKQKGNLLLATKNEELLQINNLLNNSNKEKEILLKEIHHRVKNNLQLVMSLLNIQAQDTQNISIQDFLEKGQSRIATMSLIHQNLYQTENFVEINFQTYLTNLIENIKRTFSKNNVEFEINTHDNSFDLDTSIPLGLIINELVCNALKHAFPKDLKGRIEIEIQKHKTESFLLKIKDNGIGIIKSEKNNTSIGLELVSLLVLQLKGKINRIDDFGTSYNIEFKEIV
jgi:two-component sensor histidine kinase